MKYMLLMYGAEGRWTESERTACMVESMQICDQLAAQGKYVASSPLESVTTAVTVRVRNGKTLVTDGPFAETTEQLGGYYILELEHLDEAIALASMLPPVTKGTVEIRPLFPLDGLPPRQAHPAETKMGAGRPFMLLCYDDESAWRAAGPNARQEAMAEAAALTRELDDAGRYVSASPLHPAETATCVRVRDGKRLTTDGPFAETREVLGGYYVIVAETREEAARVAARHPGAQLGAVEVRPLFEVSRLRKSAPAS
ncbi:YciI family protein [Singulisphaera sp. Ch08]|uniref:YciI family protein n=1 Tax=Singulisphaera sp. Ch08 TaxID=3120278 RepID=A0AAU7CNW9_9BACT